MGLKRENDAGLSPGFWRGLVRKVEIEGVGKWALGMFISNDVYMSIK